MGRLALATCRGGAGGDAAAPASGLKTLCPFRRPGRSVCWPFFFRALHISLVWAVLDAAAPVGDLADIVERPYVTIGLAGFVLTDPAGG